MGEKINLLDLDQQGMEALAQQLGGQPFHGRNLLKWIHRHGVTDFAVMTDLSKSLRERLAQVAEVRVPEVVFGEGKSADQVARIVARLVGAGQSALVTRLDADKAALVLRDRVQ